MQILGICVAWVASATSIIVCLLEIVKWNNISVKTFAATSLLCCHTGSKFIAWFVINL
jgi:hypothetical protein